MSYKEALVGRRGFLRDAGLFSLLAQVSWPRFLKAAPGRNGSAGGVYARLGVRPLINAAGTYTTLSACVMPREVRKAMEEAGESHVSIPELQAAVGKRIAELLGVEAALVTAGSAAALTLGTATAAMITRMSRSTMLDVLGREYVRTARAKGLPERRVTFHHALRNALIPVVTVAGVQLGYIVGGIVVVEDVFTLPGVGRLLLDAIFQRDYPVVQGVILLLAAAFMVLNLAVDLLYAVLDPRLRRG